MILSVSPIWPKCYGERLLLASILRRAAYDIARYRGEQRLWKRRVWMDAHRWMYDDRGEHFTSFLSICTILDQDPIKIRRITEGLKKQDIKKLELVDHARL
jgi:hypothetical protein